MPVKRALRCLSQQQQINFLLTNRIPRQLLTRFMGWYSAIQCPVLTRFSLALWKLFSDLDLSDSKQQQFASLRDCFIRELKDGARPVDPQDDIVVSPCDAIVGTCGRIEATTLYQVKGFPYDLEDLIPDPRIYQKYRDGNFVTLRLQSTMYHRFHAPVDCTFSEINYISGDTWNVNPIALQRIEKLFCKNERAVVDLDLGVPERAIALVPVAAILVASMKFHCLDIPLDLRYRGPNRLNCDAAYLKGEELGYFQHGSTILLFATANYRIHAGIEPNCRIRMGEALLVDGRSELLSSTCKH